MLKQLQTNDQIFHSMLALISTARPEKAIDRNTKLKVTSGTIDIHQQRENPT